MIEVAYSANRSTYLPDAGTRTFVSRAGRRQ